MSEITGNHIEWAVVRRLAIMLEAPDPQFNVTQAYGLLAPIVCWVMQRARARDGLADPLRRCLIVEPPWNLSGSHFREFHAGLITDVRNLTAFDFLIGFRNAIAHGDSRKVKPLNSPPDMNDCCTLKGFSFNCETHTSPRPHQLLWRGIIHLYEDDMRRLGLELADEFCTSLGVNKPELSAIASARVREHA